MKASLSTLRLASVALAAVSFLTGAARADVTVISFGGSSQKAQAKAFYEPFAKTGGKVVPGEYNGEQAKIKAMVETGNVTWDVVEVESPELARGCEEGIYEKLDMSRVGTKSDFVPEAVTECGIGAFVWSTVLAYNADVLKTPPRSWADFWDIGKYPGKRGMRKGAKFTLEFALLADGVKPEEVYGTLATPAGVERAFRKLDEIKPHIQWWEAGAQPPQLLASGDLVMSSAYNGRIGTAQKEGKTNLKIVWTNHIYDFDSWAITSGTPKRDEAYRFIAVASAPQNQAVFSALIPYGPSNVKALPLIDPATLAELPTAPQNMQSALASDPQFWAEYGEDLEQRFNAWAAK